MTTCWVHLMFFVETEHSRWSLINRGFNQNDLCICVFYPPPLRLVSGWGTGFWSSNASSSALCTPCYFMLRTDDADDWWSLVFKNILVVYCFKLLRLVLIQLLLSTKDLWVRELSGVSLFIMFPPDGGQYITRFLLIWYKHFLVMSGCVTHIPHTTKELQTVRVTMHSMKRMGMLHWLIESRSPELQILLLWFIWMLRYHSRCSSIIQNLHPSNPDGSTRKGKE